jgi:hypothetical protein
MITIKIFKWDTPYKIEDKTGKIWMIDSTTFIFQDFFFRRYLEFNKNKNESYNTKSETEHFYSLN